MTWTVPASVESDGTPLENRLDWLRKNLEIAWSAETSADPTKWMPANPAWGQCAVTALLVQELLGGILLRAKIQGSTHYWNVLPNGTEIDLTRQQFGENVKIDSLPEPRSRDYVLSFPETQGRYLILRNRALLTTGHLACGADRC